MQLLDHHNIQLLLRDQQFEVAAATRWRNCGIEERLGKISLRECERFRLIVEFDAMSSLRTSDPFDVGVGIRNRSQNQTLSGRLFQSCLSLLNRRIMLQRAI